MATEFFCLFSNECPGLCWHRLGHEGKKSKKLPEMENEKKQILKHFKGTFHWA